MTIQVEFCNTVSVLGRTWKLKPSVQVGPIAGVDPLAASVAASRGFDPGTFFDPSIRRDMPDPSTLLGMDEAVKRFCDAVEAGRRIAVYGDYDVDGATSTAMMVRWLRSMGRPCVFYIPDRISEGYGPNSPAMRKLKEEHDIEFILFLDCGTRAHEPLAVAAGLGMEIAILDHHEPDDLDPPGVLVNPKRRDETREYDYLCTAGLVFLFLVGVQREMTARSFFTDERPKVDLMKWLGIAALGTVGDMVPLKGLNRAYVKVGLPLMAHIPGIRALQAVNSDADFNERTCGWVYGPCINAEGRIGDTRSGTLLLSTDDMDEANDLAVKLYQTNVERKALTKTMVDAAIEIAVTRMKGHSTIVIYNEEWHPGIVGIVAGKVKEAVNKPAVVIGSGGTGSCRSVPGYSIGEAVDAAKEAGLIDKGGGHAMAAGLHVKPENVDALRALLCSKSDGFVHLPREIDIAMPCGSITSNVIETLQTLRPFGNSNEEPLIAVCSGYVSKVRIMKERHIKLEIDGRHGRCEALLWNGVGTPLGDAMAMSEDKVVDVIGRAELKFYAGKMQPQIKVEDMMVQPDPEEMAA